MLELVSPGSRLILEKRRNGARTPGKTPYTAAGVYYRNGVVPLFSARANKAAAELILGTIIPDLREIRAEFSAGASRFDFLCHDAAGRRHLVEVKACSLVEYRTAMFPDAPSIRALKHLEELAVLSREGYCCHVLFVILHGKPQVFIPNLHTDPPFAASLCCHGFPVNSPLGDPPPRLYPGRGRETKQGVAVHAALLRCDSTGRAVLVPGPIPVDLGHGKLAEGNSGNYLILLELPQTQEVPVGALGNLTLEAGWYVYTGSARKNLSQRISRHLRKIRKARRWHLDYLTPCAGIIRALPILSYRNLECSLARSLAALGGRAVAGFGSSDCSCKSHLYRFAGDPLENRAFVAMLLQFRHGKALIPQGSAD
jgi:sugar fermentation stimulation protein A